ALASYLSDDVDRLLLQCRENFTQRARAEEGLQNSAEPSVFRWIKCNGYQRKRTTQYVECLLRREQLGIAERGENVIATRQIIQAIHEHYGASIAHGFPPDAAIGGHRQSSIGEYR